jgi:pyruvate,water dikinase
MSTSAPLILWIDSADASDGALLGGKFGSLAEMTRAGLDIPPGFGVTTAAYRRFLDEAGLVDAARELRRQAVAAELVTVRQLSADFMAAIETAAMPQELEHAIRAAYSELGARVGTPEPPVAVRSSGESEDLAGASFAGQYDTYLWIRGIDEVMRHVRSCWAGMFGEAVLTYRPGGDSEVIADHAMCVGIQHMVDARTAGVMFTLEPVTGDPSKIAIEACWGLGEGVVKGDITPNRYIVDRVTFEIVRRDATTQTVEYRFDPETNSAAVLPVERERQDQPCLSEDEVITLAKLGKQIAAQRGAPQDIEWAISRGGDLRVLQVRPETVWSQRADRPQVIVESKSALDHVLARFAGVAVGSAPPAGPRQ